MDERQLHQAAQECAVRVGVSCLRKQRWHAGALQGCAYAREGRPDANDYLYQWDSSRDYNPSPGLEKIQAALLAINSADGERNLPESGLLQNEVERVKNGRYVILLANENTAGHGTTGQQAKLWARHLAEFLQSAPKLGQ